MFKLAANRKKLRQEKLRSTDFLRSGGGGITKLALMLNQFPGRFVRHIQLKWRVFGVQELQPSDTSAIHDRDDFCGPGDASDHPLEYLPP